MKPIQEAELIIRKETLTLEDYNRFIDLGKLIKDEKIYLQTGAGVVFDSNPKSEYQECLNKARALMVACDKIKDFFS